MASHHSRLRTTFFGGESIASTSGVRDSTAESTAACSRFFALTNKSALRAYGHLFSGYYSLHFAYGANIGTSRMILLSGNITDNLFEQ
jgi:hypothetical protein